jgi:hypothetical protein
MSGRIIRDVDGPEFDRLFTDVRQSWFRLETLQRYNDDYERDDFAAFLRGQPLDATPGPWQAMVREHVTAGRELIRVHVIEEPPSDYIRFELAAYRLNVAAGEDVRVIPIRRGDWPADVPHHDYWLFDDEHLWLMDYDTTGALEAIRLIEDPIALDHHRQGRDAAIAHSLSLADYAGAYQPA